MENTQKLFSSFPNGVKIDINKEWPNNLGDFFKNSTCSTSIYSGSITVDLELGETKKKLEEVETEIKKLKEDNQKMNEDIKEIKEELLQAKIIHKSLVDLRCDAKDVFVHVDGKEIKPTMLKWVEKMEKSGVTVIAAKKDAKFNYSGNYNQVVAKKYDVIEVMFGEDSDGMDFVYYNRLQ